MQNNRYNIQLDNPDKLTLSTNIQEAIHSMNKKYGDMGRVKLNITDYEITIGLGNNDPFMIKGFWDYMAELRDEVATVVAENGYHFDKWNLSDGYLVLKFPKGTDEKRTYLIQFLEETIDSVYAEYGQTSTAKVIQEKQELQIWFDTERPYLDKAFFEFLDKVKQGIDEKLKAEGFVFKKNEFLYDFLIWHYQYENKA